MELFYHQYGNGSPVIIMHGLFGISDNWVGIAKALAPFFNVFVVDLRNHGQSPKSPTFNYPSMVDDIREFIENHNIFKPILLGHSLGGKVAMQFSLDYPDIPDKLIVADISPKAYPIKNVHLDVLSAMQSVDFKSISSRAEVEIIIGSMIHDDPLKLFILKNLFRPNKNTFAWRVNLESIQDNIENIVEEVKSRYPFKKPTLFLKGEYSDYILDEDKILISKLFSDFSIETIANGTHWLHADNPSAFTKRVLSFAQS